jgi:hypothetical protein
MKPLLQESCGSTRTPAACIVSPVRINLGARTQYGGYYRKVHLLK